MSDEATMNRRLAAILAADIAGYSRLMAEDEDSTVLALKAHQRAVLPLVTQFGGRVIDTAGDGILAEFPSIVKATECAIDIQQVMAAANATVPEDRQMLFRVGLNLGDVIFDETRIYGDGINVAARLEAMAAPGGICLSREVFDQVGRIFDYEFESLGPHTFKNIGRPVDVFALRVSDQPVANESQQVAPQLAKDSRVTPSSTGRKNHNLPSDRNPFYGRQGDIASVSALVEQHRLVSLLAIGGMGKTRLAVVTARTLLDQFPDGVWFVDLIPVTGHDGIDIAIADAIGLVLTGASQRDRLAQLIDTRNMLIILDNCEHLRDAVEDALDDLLDRTQLPHFLITSREPIGLSDEYRFIVEPLTVEPQGEPGSAVQLFVKTVERIGGSIVEDEIQTVQSVCRHLDGLPLAIELAAAQLRQLTLTELSQRLDQRFELLAGRMRGGRQRQASLMAVLADTWAMLSESESDLLGQLAVFPGPFSVADIDELTSPAGGSSVSQPFGGLVDKSLVVREDARWRLLETVRMFANQQADQETRTRYASAHAQWCLNHIGTEIQVHFYQHEMRDWCDLHYHDLLEAESHLQKTGHPEAAARLTAAPVLAMHLDMGTRAAARLRRLEEHLERITDAELRARLHVMGVASAMGARDPGAMSRHGRAAVEESQKTSDLSLQAIALVLSSWSTVFGDITAALAQVGAAANLARQARDDDTLVLAEGYRAWHLLMQGSYDEAMEVSKWVVSLAPEKTEKLRPYPILTGVSPLIVGSAIKEPALALQLTDTYLDTGRYHYAWSSDLLTAFVMAAAGRHDDALSICVSTHERMTRIGSTALPDLLIPLAGLAFNRGDNRQAASWLRVVKDAGRPTHSFLMTIAYRLLRNEVGLAADSSLVDKTLDQIAEQALDYGRIEV